MNMSGITFWLILCRELRTLSPRTSTRKLVGLVCDLRNRAAFGATESAEAAFTRFIFYEVSKIGESDYNIGEPDYNIGDI